MKIGKLLVMYRAMQSLGTRGLAEEIGVSAATINRLEKGKEIEGKTMIKIVTWLFLDEERAVMTAKEEVST